MRKAHDEVSLNYIYRSYNIHINAYLLNISMYMHEIIS